MEQALTGLLLAPGTPMITYGTESGLSGSEEPANRGDMTFEPTPLAETIRRLLALRTAHPALHRGERKTLQLTPDLWVDLRWTADASLAVIVNRSDQKRTVSLPWTDGPVLLEGARWQDGTLHVEPRTTTVVAGSALPPSSRPLRTVRWAPPTEGEGVPRLVGAHPQLGGWNPTQAPTWHGGELSITVPEGTTLAYKLAWELPDATIRWEPGPNRFHLVAGEEHPVKWPARGPSEE